MRKGLMAILALTLVTGLVGYALAQQGPSGGRHGMGQRESQMGVQEWATRVAWAQAWVARG